MKMRCHLPGSPISSLRQREAFGAPDLALALALGLATGLTGCGSAPAPRNASPVEARTPSSARVPTPEAARENAGTSAGTSAPTAPAVPASSPKAGWADLEVEGFEPARLFYRSSAPKWIVTHGAGGQAAWHCEHWDKIFHSTVTLLCPRGKKRFAGDLSRGYYYPDHLTLEREVQAMRAAFESKYEPRGAEEKYVYVGYSQGASMGALAMAAHGDWLSHLILQEGGYKDFSPRLAKQFAATGGTGVVFVCGTRACRNQVHAHAENLRASGLKVTWKWASGAGHRPDGPVTRALLELLPEVLSHDARFTGFSPTAPQEVLDGNG